MMALFDLVTTFSRTMLSAACYEHLLASVSCCCSVRLLLVASILKSISVCWWCAVVLVVSCMEMVAWQPEMLWVCTACDHVIVLSAIAVCQCVACDEMCYLRVHFRRHSLICWSILLVCLSLFLVLSTELLHGVASQTCICWSLPVAARFVTTGRQITYQKAKWSSKNELQ